MADVKVLAEELVNLTVKEVNELATILKEEYGIEPAAAAVAVAAPAAAGEAAAAGAWFQTHATALPRPLRKAYLRRRPSLSRPLWRRPVLKLRLSS